MLEINGVVMPAPLPYTVNMQDLDGSSGRAADGGMIRDRIGTKRSINLEWANVTNSEAALILSAVSPIFFTAIYDDPLEGENTVKTFYVGDRATSKGAITGFTAKVSFNIIER